MIWLNPNCREPRAPVAAGVLSVCCVCWCLVRACAAVCAAGPEDSSDSNAPSVHALFVRYCVVYYERDMHSIVCEASVALVMHDPVDPRNLRTPGSRREKECAHGVLNLLFFRESVSHREATHTLAAERGLRCAKQWYA